MDSLQEILMAMLDEEVPDHDEIVMMDEGKEEEITEMIESLMTDDAGLKDIINDFEIIQIDDDEEDGSNNFMVQQKDEEDLFAGVDHSCSGTENWWEAHVLASGADNYTEYNWCYEDDSKMWEWSEYFEMPGLIECKAAPEAA